MIIIRISFPYKFQLQSVDTFGLAVASKLTGVLHCVRDELEQVVVCLFPMPFKLFVQEGRETNII